MIDRNGRRRGSYTVKRQPTGLLESLVGLGFVGSLFGIIIGAVVAFWFGVNLLLAWGCDAIYSHFFETPGSNAPSIDFWWFVLIVIVVRAVFNRPSVSVNRS